MIGTGLIIGFCAGILSGLLGIGGGGIMVVLAVTFLGLSQHMAQATALAAALPIVLVGVINLHRKRLVNYHIALFLAIGMTAGGLGGAYLANMISGPVLQKIFSVFFAIMSIQMFLSSLSKKSKENKNEAGEPESGRDKS